MKTKLQCLALLAGLTSVGCAHATLWNIADVLGCSSGFCASLFHSATGATPMSGANVGNIDGVSNTTGALNQYDDSTGTFDGGFTLSGASGNTTVRLTGDLSFGANGLMDVVSSLQMSFDATPLYSPTPAQTPPTGDTLFFDVGYQCCGNSGFDPNSFLVSGSPFPTPGMVMTLWGANGWDPQTAAWPGANLGIDLRVLLVESPDQPPNTGAPEPGSFALTALGLAFGLRRFRGRG
jgi:hypothetical protein